MIEEAYRRPRMKDPKEYPNFSVWHDDLSKLFDQYKVPEDLLKISKEDLIIKSISLLGRYDVNLDFTKDPEKSIFILAIADSWSRTSSTREKKALLEIMKLLMIKGTEIASEYIKFLCKKDAKSVSVINPNSKEGHPVNSFVQEVYEFVMANLDSQKTEKMNSFINKKSWEDADDPILMQARKKLNITKETERPFKIIVLNKSKKDIEKMTGGAAFVMTRNGQKTLVLGSEEADLNIISHEYAHTQSEGLYVDFLGLLFRGLNEATTDLMVPSFNRTYTTQGSVLDRINSITGFELEDPLLKAYKEGGDSKKSFFQFIIERFGLEGFLKLARMEVEPSNKKTKKLASTIYISTKEVEDYFFSMYKLGRGSTIKDPWKLEN